MTLSSNDIINRFNSYINTNSTIQKLFGNSLFIALIISCIIIFIVNINNDNVISQILYSFITTFFIILVFNKIIKLNCDKKIEVKEDKSFIGMMQNNNDNKNKLMRDINSIENSDLNNIELNKIELNKIGGSYNISSDIRDFLK